MSIAGFLLAVVSFALILSSPALADFAHEQEACASAHHDGACCADAASGEMAAPMASPMSGSSASCDEAVCAMMTSCTVSIAALTAPHAAKSAVPRPRHDTPGHAGAHASASLDGLKRPPRA